MTSPPQQEELCRLLPPGVYIICEKELERLANRVRCAVPSLTMEECYSSANAILRADIAIQKDLVKERERQTVYPDYDPLDGECYD